MSDPLVGTVIQDRYKIVRPLGEGGMGAVYQGENIKIGRPVAIKVLHPEFARNPEVVARFHQEAKAATAIGHPHIIEVLDLGELPDGSTFMVLELLGGKDWGEELDDDGPQPLSHVAKILWQVCDALESAHAKGIVHRDLKPENIFLIHRHGRDDYVKVLDFGISKMLPEPGQDKSLTGTNMMLGTAYYMSPEQAKAAKHVDHRSDLWTVGIMFFEALTGAYPFDDEALPLLIIKICTENPPKLTDFRDDLPPQAQDLFRKLTEKDPAKRYQTAAEVKAALEPFMEHQGEVSLRADAPDTKMQVASSVEAAPSVVDTVPVTKSRMPLVAGLVALLAVGGIGAAVALTGESEAATVPDAGTLELAGPPDLGAEPMAGEDTETAEGELLISVFTAPDDAEATIYLDGEAQDANPLTLRVPQTGEVHTIEARAEGYESASQRVAYVSDRQIELVLERERRGGRGGRGGMRSGTSSTSTEPTPMEEPAVAPATPMDSPMEPEPVMEADTPSSRFMGI